MYELIQVGEKTYYIACPTNIGIYKIDDTRVCLIDSGSDKDVGKKILKITAAQGWEVAMIINTHSHADHIGGNNLIQSRTGCKIYAPGIDRSLVQNTILEASFLYGGFPMRELRKKFLYAPESDAQVLTEDVLPDGLTMLRVDGHSFSQAAIKADDDVWFLGDVLTGENIISKYCLQFLYDVKESLNSLEKVKTLEGRLFIPSHAMPTEDIAPLADINAAAILKNIEMLKDIVKNPIAFEDILSEVFTRNGLVMDITQNVLVGSTVKSYLAYMHEEGIVDFKIEGNKLLWFGI